jgi:hypothetical protein
MGRKKRDPHSPEAVAAVYQRIENMSKEELESWIDRLSRAPEGVYDPWSEENWPQEKEWRRPSNGRARVTDLLSPSEREAHERVLRRIENMTKEELQYWINELSHAPEGVYDPWSEENWPREKELRQLSNGATPTPDDASSPKAERAAGSD